MELALSQSGQIGWSIETGTGSWIMTMGMIPLSWLWHGGCNLYLAHLLSEKRSNKENSCVNDFFGLDGRNGVRKTCQVFLWDIKTSDMSCIVGYEDVALDIHKGLRQGHTERSYSDNISA